MGLTLTVLGCTGSYPGPGEACSGYLVQGGGVSVLVDAGPGALANLQRHLSLTDLDAVVLSHAHPDHWTDLMVLRTAWKYGLGREGLRVLGTAENRDMADVVAHGELAPTVDWQVVGDGATASVGGLELRFSATDHYTETLAVRAEAGGRSIAYSADTGPGWNLARFDAPLDLALCEATFETDADADGVLHLSATQAAASARDAGAERLVLTHLQTGADAAAYAARARAVFDGPVDVAQIDSRFEL